MEPEEQEAQSVDRATAKDLQAIIERIENLEQEKSELVEDIKGIYLEAKSKGFDAKAIRKIVALRKLDDDERANQEAILDLYLSALGMRESVG